MPKLMEDYFVGRECSRRQGRGQVGVLAEELWGEEILKMGVMIWHLT